MRLRLAGASATLPYTKHEHMPYRPMLIFLLAVAAIPASLAQSYQDALKELQEAAGSPVRETVAYFNMAKLLADTLSPHFQPDEAYDALQAAQRSYRKLNGRQQGRLPAGSYSPATARELKQHIREAGLEHYLQKGGSAPLRHYLDHYGRIPYELEARAMKALLGFRLRELPHHIDSLLLFAAQQELALKRYRPDLVEALKDQAFSAWAAASDTRALPALLELLGSRPELAAQIDAPLSEALAREPYITVAEQYIRGADQRLMPKTVRVVYFYHYYTGAWSDLLGFQNRYPFFRDSFNIGRAIAVAKMSPDLSLGYTDDRREVYERYIELAAPAQQAYVALMQLVARDLEEGDWNGAMADIRRFQPAFGPSDPRINELLENLQAQGEGLEAVGVSPAVNSIFGEYAPVLSADGEWLYFCRFDEKDENIYRSKRLGPEEWARPEAVAELNSTTNHEAPLSISTDGQQLLMYQGGEVMYATRTGSGWSAKKPFFEEARRPDWQGMTVLNSSGDVAVFAARSIWCTGARNEHNIDLFLSFREADGSWGDPINLGPALNTPFEDRSPFLHPDMRTLYFSSNGHGGFGDLDVYVSRRQGEGWLDWSEPVNLGKEINGPGQDWGYRISTDGKWAYFSGFSPGWREELYRVGVPEAYRPVPVSTIQGQLVGVDGQPVEAEVVVRDMETGAVAGRSVADPATGRFFLTLPQGGLYSYTVTGEGLFPVSNNLDLRGQPDVLHREEAVRVPRIAEVIASGEALPLPNLFFETDSDIIARESYAELRRLAQWLKSNRLQAQIGGHTDNAGGQGYNQELSERRARAVRKFLIESGAPPEGLTAVGFGFSQPVAGNETAEGRAANRRVEIRLSRAPRRNGE
ncbi:OmpA family protein [Phaeodactylibacter luteus]|uniref:OmpA family protein n=2 Tax=Phaeodactylibacter luteus TaxID=1564516 RepID=A0A5C6RHX8_9BACT|nr:OmpA family protein [Phaeodactylibacter luteus]